MVLPRRWMSYWQRFLKRNNDLFNSKSISINNQNNMKNYGWFYILVVVFITGIIILLQEQKINDLKASQCTQESNDKYYKGCIELATETATKRLIRQLGYIKPDKAGKVYLKDLIEALTIVNQESNKWAK